MKNFYQKLQTETEQARTELLSAPIIQDCFQGDITLEAYIGFLTQAFHHVKQTVPLLMACGSRLRDDQEWIRAAVVEYIDEEYGHHEWILNDIAVCGGDKEAVRKGQASEPVAMMVAYLNDAIARVNPLAIFGMVQVLEGTSVALATNAAHLIADKLSLPKMAFSYLASHGSLDVDHLKFFEKLMNQIENEADQEVIIETANRVYKLYGDMLRGLPRATENKQAA